MTKEIEKSIFDSNKLQALAKDILHEAQQKGADQAELSITANKGFSVTGHDGDVEKVEYHQDKIIEVQVYFGNHRGCASISDMRMEAVKAAVDAACHIAKYTDEDKSAGLADKEELAFHYPQLELSFPWRITVEEAIELARQCESEALAYDKRIMSAEEVSIATGEAIDLYANSNGFIGFYPHTRHEMSCVLVAKENNEMQRDYSYTVALNPDQLDSLSHIAKQAAERTVRRLGARQLPTMKAPVIFLAEEARGLIGNFVSAISGGNLYRQSSFLLDHLGKKIFPDFVHMQEQPHLPQGLSSAAFDGEGVATRPNVFIDAGVLQNYSLSVYAARKLGMKTTGNAGGVRNLIVRPGEKDLAGLLKTMDKGLLITEMMGSGTNILTGDYSRGAGGYWVENGQIQYPVHEITVAGGLQDIFAKIVAIGNDVDIRGGIRTGSILIEEMMIAGS